MESRILNFSSCDIARYTKYALLSQSPCDLMNSVRAQLVIMVIGVIKTITKFSNVIGYQQPDLSINWTVAHVMLVIGQYAPFCARCCGSLC